MPIKLEVNRTRTVCMIWVKDLFSSNQLGLIMHDSGIPGIFKPLNPINNMFDLINHKKDMISIELLYSLFSLRWIF